MDRLIVLDEGRIVEQGSHEELLALRGHYEKPKTEESSTAVEAWNPLSILVAAAVVIGV